MPVARIGGSFLRPPFVFYVGSYEKRKNLEPLLEAWARLPPPLRARWQLALCCPLKPLERNHLLHRAGQLQITESLCLTGFVDDDTLLLLHQGSDLFVFPSLYEGYGLPVAEALACGSPVLAADASSLPEIVGPEALFDPTDPALIAAAIERGLTDEAFRQRLRAAAGRPPSTWKQVAAATMDVYRSVLDGALLPPGGDRRRGSAASPGANASTLPTRRRRLAVAGPFPPDGGEFGRWTFEFVQALAGRPDLEVTAFADHPFEAERKLRTIEGPRAVTVHPLGALDAVEGLRGRFDTVVYTLADDAHHTGCLAALRRRKDGIVIAHCAMLSGLYGEAARSGALAGGLQRTIRGVYGDGVHPGVGTHDQLTQAEAQRLGIFLIRDVLAHCRSLLVTGPVDRALADLDALREDRSKIGLTAGEPIAAAATVYNLVPSPD